MSKGGGKWLLKRTQPLHEVHHKCGAVHIVLVSPKSINTPSKFIKIISPLIKTMEIVQQSIPLNCQTSTFLRSVSHVSRSLLPGKERVLTIQEGLCFLRRHGFLGI